MGYQFPCVCPVCQDPQLDTAFLLTPCGHGICQSCADACISMKRKADIANWVEDLEEWTQFRVETFEMIDIPKPELPKMVYRCFCRGADVGVKEWARVGLGHAVPAVAVAVRGV